MAVSHVYNNGTNSTSGANTIVHFYDRAGIKASNRINIYQQFASRKHQPTKMGKTFKISKWMHMYDREDESTDFGKYGFMTYRNIDTVSSFMSDTSGAGAGLPEGAGAQNKRILKKITFETSLKRYGEMLDYTDEVELFSEDHIQIRYREELGELANSRYEDLVQLDLLSTPTKMYGGTAASQADLGTGVAADGSDDDIYRVSYDLIRKSVKKLVQNRAKKNTSLVVGSTKISTKPVAKAFFGIVDASVKIDLEILTRGTGTEKEYVFVPVHQYASPETAAEGEIGAIHEARFLESEGAMVDMAKGATIPASYAGTLSYSNNGTDDKFDVHPILFPSQDAFAIVGLKGRGRMKFLSMAPEDIDRTNPYGNQGFFSVNYFYAGILLKPEAILRVDVLASA